MSDTFDYCSVSPSNAIFLRKTACQVRVLVKRVTPTNIKIGDHLTAARERLPHGQFGKYCVDAVGITLRSAENYMSLAELANIFPRSLVAQLPARAGYKLAENATPPALVAEMMSEVAAGHIPTFHEVESRIAAAEPAEPNHGVLRNVDDLADQLLRSLDSEKLDEVVRFLRMAKKPAIAMLCERLQQGLKRQPLNSASDFLPQIEL
jgi:hypothetical protein